MRRRLSKLVWGGLLAALLSGSAWAQGRMATVDLGKLLAGYNKTKQARDALNAEQADIEKEHAKMLKDLTRDKDEYQALRASANDQVLSPEEREKRSKLADDKAKQFRESEDSVLQYERAARTKLEEEWRRLLLKVLDDIKSVIEAKAKSAGYAFVVDASGETARGTPFILFSNGESDLTQAVLDQLNAAAPPDAKSSEKPGEKKK